MLILPEAAAMTPASSWYPILSSVLGWTYFLAWSISFYPQAILNWRRRSVVGLSLDYVWLNALGFLCYSIYSVAFLSSRHLRREYRHRQHALVFPAGTPLPLADDAEDTGPLVRVNDACFAIHALLITLFILAQAYTLGYKRAVYQRVSFWCKILLGTVLIAALILLALAWRNEAALSAHDLFNLVAQSPAAGLLGAANGELLFIDILYLLSYVKLALSLLKCLPQLYLNFARRSTRGWSIVNILLDFTGGALSLLQITLDAAVVGDWSGLLGNPVKTGLGVISIVFDILFMLQHYVLYGDDHAPEPEETDPDALRRAREGVAGLDGDVEGVDASEEGDRHATGRASDEHTGLLSAAAETRRDTGSLTHA